MRDELLGRSGGDRDFVVVGATPQEMINAGFEAVGADFPVFINPQNGEEYALARTERKSGRGYKGFVFYAEPSVSLEEDLRRRDLTINAMAKGQDGRVIDPHNGRADLQNKILRHVSPAFAEDPLRVLRVARFAAALPDFSIAPPTMELMQKITASGELAELSGERVWRELARGLVAARPSKMLQALSQCGALAALLPEVEALRGVPERLDYHPEGETWTHTNMVVDAAAARGNNAAVCFAALLHDSGKAKTPAEILPSHHGHEAQSAKLAKAVCERLRPPKGARALAILAAAEHGNVHKSLQMRAATVERLLARADAYRRPQQLAALLRVCEADFYYLPARAGKEYEPGAFLRAAREAAMQTDAAAIAAAAKTPALIAGQVAAARAQAIENIRQQNPRWQQARGGESHAAGASGQSNNKK